MSDWEADARGVLLDWFSRCGSDAQYEIEARIRDVSELGFSRVLSALSSLEWSNQPRAEDTIDLLHVSGVRQTNSQQGSSFLRKTRHALHDAFTPERSVRFALASELPCREDSSPVSTYRYKQRTSFCHKRAFKLELTRVKQGPSMQAALAAEVGYEVEIEWCGQAEQMAQWPDYLADSLLMKVSGLLALLQNPKGGNGAMLIPGELQEATPVRLTPGIDVPLLPVGYGAALPFEGEMPAELAAEIRWVFSHKEASTGDVFIMNLPTNLGGKAYPLYYFYGRVPATAIAPS